MKRVEEEESELDEALRRLGSEAENHLGVLSTLGEAGTKSKASELNKTVEGILKTMRRHLRDFEQLAEEQETKEASLKVANLVGEHKVRYEHIKKKQEQAFQAMKKNSEEAWRKKRQELLSGAVSRSQITDERSAIAASEGITESLRRTRELMNAQISHTEGTTELVGTSTHTLQKTKHTLKAQKEMFGTSKRLLRAMSWQDVLDRIVLYGGVGFFIIVVLYIVQKRMLGLTPDIVKNSVSHVFHSSLNSSYALYEQLMQSKSESLDPSKPSDSMFDDLADISSQEDLIKAHVEEPMRVEEDVHVEETTVKEESPPLDTTQHQDPIEMVTDDTELGSKEEPEEKEILPSDTIVNSDDIQEASSSVEEKSLPLEEAHLPEQETSLLEEKTGLPVEETSLLEEETSLPEDDKGLQEDDKGSQEDDKGLPEDDKGLQEDDKGSQEDDKGLPEDDKGLPEDDKGLPEEPIVTEPVKNEDTATSESAPVKDSDVVVQSSSGDVDKTSSDTSTVEDQEEADPYADLYDYGYSDPYLVKHGPPEEDPYEDVKDSLILPSAKDEL